MTEFVDIESVKKAKSGLLEPWHWLNDRASLTDKLEAVSGSSLQVSILKTGCEYLSSYWFDVEYIDKSFESGYKLKQYLKKSKVAHEVWPLLSISGKTRVFKREVLLSIDNIPWVYARTFAPVALLKNRKKRLNLLGNRSIGRFILQADAIPRVQLVPIRMRAKHLSSMGKDRSQKYDNKGGLVGRRSHYDWQGCPLYIDELFLSTCPFFANYYNQ
ncbi:MAG: chorismate lyase [Pseudomonadota bacterium]